MALTYSGMVKEILDLTRESEDRTRMVDLKRDRETREIDTTIAKCREQSQDYTLQARMYEAKAVEYAAKADRLEASRAYDLEMVAERGRQRRILAQKKLKHVISTLPEASRATILAELLENHPDFDLLRDLSVQG